LVSEIAAFKNASSLTEQGPGLFILVYVTYVIVIGWILGKYLVRPHQLKGNHTM